MNQANMTHVSRSYNEFIDKVHSGQVANTDLYAVVPKGSLIKMLFQSLKSFSIWPFYLMLGVMILLSKWIITL